MAYKTVQWERTICITSKPKKLYLVKMNDVSVKCNIQN